MRQGRNGIKVLGLMLIAALAVMAFTAAAAQAGEYKINGSTLTTLGLASESVEGTVAEGELLVPGLSLNINCKKGTFTGTIKKGGGASAKILYSECEVLGNKFCKTYETKANMESEVNAGNLVAEGSGEIILMGEKHYLLVSSGATPFTTVYFTKSTKGCTLPLEETVSGSTVFLLPTALTSLVTQTVETIPQATLETLFATDILKYGNQTAWLDGGKTSVVLSGANKGKPWSGE